MIYLKRIGLALFVLLSFTANGKKGIYLKLHAGGGVTNTYDDHTTTPVIYNSAKQAAVNIGFLKGGWHLETGIEYIETGCKMENVSLYMYSNFNILSTGGTNGVSNPTGDVSLRFKHIMVPVTLGYDFKSGKHWSLVPMIGTGLSYNLNPAVIVDAGSGGEKVTGTYYQTNQVRISVWATARLAAEYNVTDNLAVFLQPQANMIVSKLVEKYRTDSKNFALTATVGLRFLLKKTPAKHLPKWEDEHPSS
jgi:hypothetical protein